MEKILNKYFSPKQKQWVWFVILWCGGLGSAMLLGFMIRTVMGINSL